MTRLLLLAALLLGGCSLVDSDDDTFTATGRVVLAETGEPIVGLGVSFCNLGNSVGCSTVDVDETDADGAFALTYSTPRPDITVVNLTVNDEPYDQGYGVRRFSLRRGEDLALDTVQVRRIGR